MKRKESRKEGMARAVRIEYAGALYHVMARGDRREAIVKDDEDREMFVRTLGEASVRAGFRIHAWVLMDNHYHLLLETPEPNLAQGMGWMQNAFTRRINTRHRLWGHVFGDRYKAVVVEPGNYYWALWDYIHLNPVRAGLVWKEEGLETYRWSSLREYVRGGSKRAPWMETGMAFDVTGCRDTAAGRRRLLEMLEERVDWRNPGKAGTESVEGEGKAKLAVHSALRRGWMFGSQAFKERLLEVASGALVGRTGKKADGYHGSELKDHGEMRAKRILSAGRAYFSDEGIEWRRLAKSDWKKALIAELIQRETTVRLDWISRELAMGERSTCCRAIGQMREALSKDAKWRSIQSKIAQISISNA